LLLIVVFLTLKLTNRVGTKRVVHILRTRLCTGLSKSQYFFKGKEVFSYDTVTDFIKALPGNSFLNTNIGNSRRETMYSVRSAPSKSMELWIIC
jgi:hypothetical protein